jgi:hypothetical protein
LGNVCYIVGRVEFVTVSKAAHPWFTEKLVQKALC